MLVTAVRIDFIEGLEQEHSWNLYNNIAVRFDLDEWAELEFEKSGYEAVQHFFKSAEELFFEAGAILVLWYLFLRHLLGMSGTIRISTKS